MTDSTNNIANQADETKLFSSYMLLFMSVVAVALQLSPLGGGARGWSPQLLKNEVLRDQSRGNRAHEAAVMATSHGIDDERVTDGNIWTHSRIAIQRHRHGNPHAKRSITKRKPSRNKKQKPDESYRRHAMTSDYLTSDNKPRRISKPFVYMKIHSPLGRR